MPDSIEEIAALTNLLDERGIDYALCGGMVMAAYGRPLGPLDADVLVLPESAGAARGLAESLGFLAAPEPFTVGGTIGGAIRARRFTKRGVSDIDGAMFDLIEVSPELAEVWQDRRRFDYDGLGVWVVSKAGAFFMAKLTNASLAAGSFPALDR